jgi:outer membrane lipoprotein-sorting protein
VDTQKQAKEVETKLQEAMKEIGIKDYSFDQIKLIDTEKNEKTTNLASKKKNKQKNATGNETMYR